MKYVTLAAVLAACMEPGLALPETTPPAEHCSCAPPSWISVRFRATGELVVEAGSQRLVVSRADVGRVQVDLPRDGTADSLPGVGVAWTSYPGFANVRRITDSTFEVRLRDPAGNPRDQDFVFQILR